MWQQVEITLRAKSRGFHIVTEEVVRQLPELPSVGLLNLFIKHTSAALTINENYDPDVREDLESIFDRLIREREPYYTHTMEGPDDMPSHAKTILVGPSLTIPITDGRPQPRHLAGYLPLRVPQPRRRAPRRSTYNWRVMQTLIGCA